MKEDLVRITPDKENFVKEDYIERKIESIQGIIKKLKDIISKKI